MFGNVIMPMRIIMLHVIIRCITILCTLHNLIIIMCIWITCNYILLSYLNKYSMYILYNARKIIDLNHLLKYSVVEDMLLGPPITHYQFNFFSWRYIKILYSLYIHTLSGWLILYKIRIMHSESFEFFECTTPDILFTSWY